MRNVTIAICCGLFLSGCSSFAERHQASGSFDYLAQKQQTPLKIPSRLTSVEVNHQYQIPVVGSLANSALMGDKLDIRAPSLVMPVAADSLVSEENKSVEVVFESFKNSAEFQADLWKKLTTFISDKGYGTSLSRQGSSLTTRAIESDPYFKLVFGLEDDQSLTQQYVFSLNVEAQGHKAILAVDLLKHQESGNDVELNQFAKRRYETRMLNLLLSHVYQQAQLAKLASRELSTQGMVMELGFDHEQNSAYIVNAAFESAWEKLARVLPTLGFRVEDRDKTLGTYFVEFDEADSGFWSSLFSSNDVEPLALEQESYQVKLEKSGVRSILTIIDKTGDKLSAEKMLSMSNTFKAVFAKKQL
ncbi:MAG: outer membrane protein assembly factor BamC [Gammaproteobacteria bacterium]|nr:outer membrane protein assembly factor BamC [Gammaproteobacteria bacterium]